MKRNIKLLILMMGITIPLMVNGQTGEISGKVVDNNGEPAISATVQALEGGIVKGGTVTDYDGNYVLKPLLPGKYTVKVYYIGFKTTVTENIIVSSNKLTTLNIKLKPNSGELKEVVVTSYKVPLIDIDQPGGRRVITGEEIDKMPTRNTSSVASVGGARGSGTLYYVDGVQVVGGRGINMSQGVIDQVAVESNTESYKKRHENDFKSIISSPLSTLSIDVDRASYSNIRRYIENETMPPVDAVRIEEMVNYFDYQYPQPKDKDPIAITTELTDCPWNKKHKLLHIGMQAKNIETENLPPSNLVFLIDVSGSMSDYNKLPLVKKSLTLLTKQLRAVDKISIVVYAGSAGIVLPPTPGDRKTTILNALEELEAGGSTAGGEGIELAYKIAEENFIKKGNNRIVLATDGDFNVGISGDNELEDLIARERTKGIFLTCLGFGMGNYKDSKLEVLADKGNGNYAYIDNEKEARKTLVKEFSGTIFTVAKDVKAQIEFNPTKVQGYRLLGYENRVLNTEDFKDDKKDAGEMGAGHTVTILYEVIPAKIKSKDTRIVNDLKYQHTNMLSYPEEFATIKFRYKDPDKNKSKEMTHVIYNVEKTLESAQENVRFATSVVMFGMLLTDSKHKGNTNYKKVLALAESAKGEDKEGYRSDFLDLVETARTIKKSKN
ncbi:MAG: von Willebrand factor type A domain-containing protein [Flavipsychrobacter sp.]